MFCPRCGQENPAGARFCSKCGAPLVQTFAPGVGSSYSNGWEKLWPRFWMLLLIWIVTIILNAIGSVFSIFYTIFAGMPINFGVSYAYLRAARGENVSLDDMFAGFKNYWNAIGASILVALSVIAGFILLIIPGIYVACKLSFVPYLVVDRKMGATDAIGESWRMTSGHAWKVFLIGLLGIPIVLAGLLCLGVGVIISYMWINMALASLYHAVSLAGPLPQPSAAAA